VAAGLRLTSGRVVPWSDVYYVDWTAAGARVATAAGAVEVDRADATRAEQRVAPHLAQRDAWVEGLDDEARVRLTGVRHAVTLVSRQGWDDTCLVSVIAGGGLLFAILPFLEMDPSAIAIGTAIMLPFALLLWVAAAWLWQVTVGPDISRDQQGLRVGRLRPLRLRWSDLREAAEVSMPTRDNMNATHLVVLTRHGRVVLKSGYNDGLALRAAVQAVLAARREAVPAGAARGRYAPRLKRPGEGLWLDGDGLVLVSPKGLRGWPWSALGVPTWHADGPRLRTGSRTLRLAQYLDGESLAQVIDAHIGGDESWVDAASELRGEVIERWLGVRPGGALRCGLSRWLVVGCGVTVLSVVALFILTVFEGGHHGGAGQNIGMGLVMFISLLSSVRSVAADARGLSVRRGRRREYYAWSDIASLTQAQFDWVIGTRHGELRLSRAANGSDRVIGIVKRLLAAREQGAQLPDDVPLPEHAISLARMGGEPDADRGLSVAAGPREP
jgi:hypothetical protein